MRLAKFGSGLTPYMAARAKYGGAQVGYSEVNKASPRVAHGLEYGTDTEESDFYHMPRNSPTHATVLTNKIGLKVKHCQT